MKAWMRYAALMLAALLVCLPLTACQSHIEDTNGEDDHSLTTLTDADLVKKATSSVTTTLLRSEVNGKGTVKVGKLSGVTTLDEYTTRNDRMMTYTATLTSGNLRLVLVQDGEIVAELPVDGAEHTVLVPSASGRVMLRAGGESARFEFSYELTDASADGNSNG